MLLLNIWREVGRHLRIEEFIANILPLLQRGLGVEGVAVHRLDLARDRLDPLALDGALATQEGVLQFSAPWRSGSVSEWCRCGETWSGTAAELSGHLPLEVRWKGALWAGGLVGEGKPLGLMILATRSPLTADRSELASTLLEPFAAAVENDRRLRELNTLREAAEADRQTLLTRLKRQDISDTVVGAESGLREVMERVNLVARSDTPVLILGETGTGKEVVARAIHRRSPRAAGPFLRVNCGAIPPELIDSELFGHERGSFTGAVATRQGWFERADGGSLFLDEIGELSPAAQVRLLRVLQDGSFQRVGAQHIQTVDVRVVAATHRDLHAMVSEGGFREDLWYRIAVFPIRLPALRERPRDIPELAAHFSLQASQRLGLAPQFPSPTDIALLTAYPWPGNVRELASVLERAAILGNGRRLEVAKALGQPLGMSQPVQPRVPAVELAAASASFDTLDNAARQHIESALTRCSGRVEGLFGAARLLGINPNTLRSRMRRLGIEPRTFRLSS